MAQTGRFASPWSLRKRIMVGLWQLVWMLLFRPSPKHLYKWRGFLLRLFGAEVARTAFVAQSARIKMPWNLVLGERACIGDAVVVYNLDVFTMEPLSVVAQECYVCGGTHDFSSETRPLVVAPILIGRNAFVGVRALLLPGVTVGPDSIVGAGAVVTRDVEGGVVVAGNPARPIRTVNPAPVSSPER